MQILASALPGFRDLRAPLTAGYLWLILLWLVVKPDIKVRPANKIAASVYDLAVAVGPIWTGLAIGAGAYLLGSISQELSPWLARVVRLCSDTWNSRIGGRVTSPPGPVHKYGPKTFQLARDYGPQDEEGENIILETEEHIRRNTAAQKGVEMEIQLPATLLLGKEPQVFSEADRLKAEGQFRLALIPPLVLLTVFLTWNESCWWVMGFAPAAIFLWQSYRKDIEYRNLMYAAIETGAITSKSLDEYIKWVDDIPNRKSRG